MSKNKQNHQPLFQKRYVNSRPAGRLYEYE
nr:MAG TPA: hypothetical protein [Caudoviricetes sp.]